MAQTEQFRVISSRDSLCFQLLETFRGNRFRNFSNFLELSCLFL
ncbi:hypothetical protein NIES2104_40770 [Leptolyngbya sp. NIES-2104]|nr:hypothetical protein NIES2104_40770 [Leptolyngbya sp. NIES-2104]